MTPLDWMDVTDLPFKALLLLERAQIRWFPRWNFPEPEISLALAANPEVVWFLRHKCPEVCGWVDRQLERAARLPATDPETIRRAEVAVLRTMVDLMVYAIDPARYDAQPFLAWDSRELTGLSDFSGATVIDVGAGTGRLAFAAAPAARVVFAVEPVANLRDYLREKARRLGLRNVYPVDGLITAIPFPDGFAGVTMSGHVFGDDPAGEAAELERVTRPGGTVILCPGNNDVDNDAHRFLVARGYTWSVFVEPPDGRVRKYWKQV